MLGRIVGILDKFLTLFENWTLFIAVMAGLLSLFVNVVLRYGFNYSLAWSEELIREIIVYTTFIGCSAAVKNRSMITIDALPQIMPRLKIPLTFVSHGATLVFGCMIAYLGWQMAALQVATQQKTIILEIPLVILYAILPMMGIMMTLRTLQVIYMDVKAHFMTSPEEEPS